MAFDFGGVNEACLTAFGQAFTFTPAATGVPQTITGILDSGAVLEGVPPGEESAYAILWIKSTVTLLPVAGDEIATTTTVYKIAGEGKADAGEGVSFILRRDRAVA